MFGEVKMANIQQQPESPLMDHKLLEALINGNPYEMLGVENPEVPAGVVVVAVDQEAANNEMLEVVNPAYPAADEVTENNQERLLQGVTSEGDGVLHIAARMQNVNLVSAISHRWRNVVDVVAKNKRGETALHCAAATGNVAMIDTLLTFLAEDGDKKRQLLRMQKHNWETCLHEAVRCGEKAVVERLVQEDVTVVRGPNDGRALVKIRDEQGVSPLYLATTLRQLDIVEFLTRQDGPVRYPAASYDGPRGKTALHAAVLLSKDLSKHLASWNNELIDWADESGSTPLHLLASTKETIVMKLLLDADASAGYHADNEGSLPIHVAAANGSLEIVKLLSEHCPGCSWSCNNLGQTILHIAVQTKSIDVVYYICSGQKFTRIFNSRDIDGNTALHLAVLKGDQLIFCRLMRRREVCLGFTNKEERTPLDLAQMSLPPGISLLKGPRHWIAHSLVLAGADYGACRSDHLPRNVAKPDKEKESETIGKSAGLVAVCAVLIFTTAFAAPFSVTNLYNKKETSKVTRVFYHIFVMFDALAFGSSAVAISCATLAGFSFTDKGTRLFYLAAGVGTLRGAALFLIFVFAAGLYVAVGPVVHSRAFLIVSLFVSAYPLVTLPLAKVGIMVLHARALISRFGFRAGSKILMAGLLAFLPLERRQRFPARHGGLWGLCAKGFPILPPDEIIRRHLL